jgi:glycosyltransferase involved in cell wall biosynthesis
MKRLKILTWPIHGSYFNTLARIDHDWYVPYKPDRSEEGYGGFGPTFDIPDYVREVSAEQVRDLDLDLIIFQSPKNYFEDQNEILSPEQLRLPKIYLEHNAPRPHPTDSRHPVDEPNVLLVHVTHYNCLMWDNGRTPTIVIEHSVAIEPTVTYKGQLERGITVINSMSRRGRIVGYDIFLEACKRVPLDIAGIQTEEIGGLVQYPKTGLKKEEFSIASQSALPASPLYTGEPNTSTDFALGDIPYRYLHRRIADYRFMFSPIRYTSLPLAVVEGLTIGMPVVALATTELPTVIENGKHGYLSCNIDELIERMNDLLAHPEEAKRLSDNARKLAQERFSLERFIRDWNRAFSLVTLQYPNFNALKRV